MLWDETVILAQMLMRKPQRYIQCEITKASLFVVQRERLLFVLKLEGFDDIDACCSHSGFRVSTLFDLLFYICFRFCFGLGDCSALAVRDCPS